MAKRLAAADAETPELDARLLLEAITGLSAAELAASDRGLNASEAKRLEAIVARREAREPMSQILGRKAFWSHEFIITPDVLTPRSDSETLIEAVLAEIASDSEVRILDLGMGSGCLLLTLLAERPGLTGIGVDASEAALAVAQKNAEVLGVADRADLRLGQWDAGLEGRFDVIISNPPYIASGEIETLEPEVRDFEPRLALDGGADGLGAYRALAPVIAARLRPGGVFAVEIGWGQGASVREIFAAQANLKPGILARDLGGIERILMGRSLAV